MLKTVLGRIDKDVKEATKVEETKSVSRPTRFTALNSPRKTDASARGKTSAKLGDLSPNMFSESTKEQSVERISVSMNFDDEA
ncbi:hypothetical protein AGDE_15218 [Angomonas deanei]|uniref:Uncharacterized protein n=1 Tax=Angomonas deanei TaxID=59799 RepID=A0A7G2CLL0_9TRYP|nr:hypothetical protein AGDE_15218 [Angomonas deanei]CAD2219443.1 hypothetical protein, conserved [Angomonas deanei]|eukprot:EPY19483.1 hypothetical protein AGDE_15218 [Angomonas deanei]